MRKTSREKSNTGIYHVLLRGINKQRIFEDDEDYSSFIETLRKYKPLNDGQNPYLRNQ